MSARDPHYCSPASPRILSANLESMLVACRELGLTAKLHGPDLCRDPQLAVIATGDEMRALNKWRDGEAEERHRIAKAWVRRNSELNALCAQGNEAAKVEWMIHNGRTPGPSNYAFAPRPRGGWGSDYEREDENKQRLRVCRCFDWSDLVVETCEENGLRRERISHPDWQYVLVRIWATKAEYRAAQYEWLQKMISTQPKVTTEELEAIDDLFDRSEWPPKEDLFA